MKTKLLLLILVFYSSSYYSQLNCSNPKMLTINSIHQGNTANGDSNFAFYNNDPWWNLTGKENVYQLDWTGGSLDIELTNKSAALGLILLNSCDGNSGWVEHGGNHTDLQKSSIANRNLDAGTYYIVVDGYDGAEGTYDLQVKKHVLDCTSTTSITSGTTYLGDTSIGNSNFAFYNNDPWWDLTGKEIVYQLNWSGGTLNIELTNKSDNLGLMLLNSCDGDSGYEQGGPNRDSTQNSIISKYLDAGTYYIVVDGYAGAEGTYDLRITQSESINVGTLINPIIKNYTLENNILYEVDEASNKTQIETNVAKFGKSFAYMDSPSTGKAEDVLWIKKIGEDKARRYSGGNFNNEYLKQILSCNQGDFNLYADVVFNSSDNNILENTDVLRCENGNTVAHQKDGNVKLYLANNTWLDIKQIITVNSESYYIKKDDYSIWQVNSGSSSKIGENGFLLQDNDNQLINITTTGSYKRYNTTWESITPKYVGVSPEIIDEGFWFFIQSKKLLDTGGNENVDHKMGLTYNASGELVMALIPETGNSEEFLWKVKNLANGKKLLINKAKGTNKPLLMETDGSLTFDGNTGNRELEITISNKKNFGTVAYNIKGLAGTKALFYDESVSTATPIASKVNQTWVFQFNQMVKDYFLPLANQANLQSHYENSEVNISQDGSEITKDYNKFLKGDNGVTFFGTNTSSDWVVVNYYLAINNMMNAIVNPLPSFGGHTSKALSELKGQSLIIINKNDTNREVVNQYFTEGWSSYDAGKLRGSASFGNDKKWNLVSEELTNKTGIVQVPTDKTTRRFDHGIHEFTHTLQGILDWIPLVDSEFMCESERGKNSECFCGDVQNWFDSTNGQNLYPTRRTVAKQGKTEAERLAFMAKIFNIENTWMPQKILRKDGYSPSGPTVDSSGPIVTLTLIPDANFEKALIDSNIDSDGIVNGQVLTSDINTVTSLYIPGKSIEDLTGIEDFTALTSLSCFNNSLTNLDLSNNTALTTLSCSNNSLTSLDVSTNTALTSLRCSNNSLTSLDVSSNTALNTLWVYENSLTSLDVCTNTSLTSLICYKNSLTSIDVSTNTALTSLYVDYNSLTSLDVSTNTALTSLYASGNSLTSLDVSNNKVLTYLNCSENSLTSLNVQNGNNSNMGEPVEAIYGFNATTNPNLTCIQVDDVAFSDRFWGSYKDIAASFSLDCSSSLYTLIPDTNFEQALIDKNIDSDKTVNGKVLTSDINTITYLNVVNNGISDLTGIEGFTALNILEAQYNSLTSIDVSSNPALTQLYTYYNSLTSLDVSNNLALTTLSVFNNSLTSLDVGNNLALTSLYTSNNSLTSLNVSNGNNNSFRDFSATNNPNLTCIQVDNVAYSDANWPRKDATASYNTDCSSSLYTLIPDTNFEQALIDKNIDSDKTVNGQVLTSDINTVTSLNVSNKSIEDLTGIEDFIALNTLYVFGNPISSLDVSNNLALDNLQIHYTSINSLDVSNNISLTRLIVASTPISSLDVSNNVILDGLSISASAITSLDVNNNTMLTFLDVNSTSISDLDLSNQTSLTLFRSQNTPNLDCITVADESAANSGTGIYSGWTKDATASYSLDCSSSLYTLIPDVNFEQALIDLNIDSEALLDGQVLTSDINTITSLNVSNKGISDLTGIEDFTALTSLNVSSNSLTSLDVSNNATLTDLDAYGNNLTSLDVSTNTALTTLNAGGNSLTSLDVSTNTALTRLFIQNNSLIRLDVSNNPVLTRLDTYNNKLTRLDVSSNYALTRLYANNNRLTRLVVSHNKALTHLNTSVNSLTSLDVSHNKALTILITTNNSLASLDISNNLALKSLYTDNNSLTSLDISNNPVLTALYTHSNNLTSLNISNSSITHFNTTNNPNLTCIQVDNVAYSDANWSTNKDATATYSLNCNEEVLSVDNNLLNESIAIYPNPSKIFVQISVSNNLKLKSVDVYNLIGKKVISTTTNRVQIKDLVNGIYFIKIITDKGFLNKKFIKE